MTEINKKYKTLVNKYIVGTASVDELASLGRWLEQQADNEDLFNQLKEEAEAKLLTAEEESWKKFNDKYEIDTRKTSQRRLIITLSSFAAAVSIVIGLSFSSLSSSFDKYASLQIEQTASIHQTTLKLADGTTFSMDEKHATVLIDEKGVHFIGEEKQKTEETSIVDVKAELNTIQVPYGRTAQLSLADSTKVWLNAGSQLIFPSHFDDSKNREVMLIGEGYFDVAHNEAKPFVVLTDEMTYTVLGTSFNISSYKSSPSVSAVLVEGSLQVERNTTFNKQQTILKPGQKCNYHKSNASLHVKEVNTAIYSSWKDGYLSLDKNSFRMLAKQIEQFYNCEIVICKQLQNMPLQLSGKLLLDDDVNRVYQALCDLTGVNYRIKGNQVEFFNQE